MAFFKLNSKPLTWQQNSFYFIKEETNGSSFFLTDSNGIPFAVIDPEKIANYIVQYELWEFDTVQRPAYGYLYNWYAVSNVKGLVKPGWTIPSQANFDDFYDYIADYYSGYPNLDLRSKRQVNAEDPKYMTSDHPRWDSLVDNFGLDSLKLNILPNGVRNQTVFSGLGSTSKLWTTTISETFAVNYLLSQISFDSEISPKYMGFAVRCFRNATANEKLTKLDGDSCGFYVGNDNKIYDTTYVGQYDTANAKVWITQNLAETLYNDGTSIVNITDQTSWANDITGALCSYNNDAQYVMWEIPSTVNFKPKNALIDAKYIVNSKVLERKNLFQLIGSKLSIAGMSSDIFKQIKKSSKNIYDDYSDFSDIIFWELVGLESGLLFNNKRFSTLADCLLELQSVLQPENSNPTYYETFILRAYLQHDKYYDSQSNRVVSYNALLSGLKGKNQYRNNEILTVDETVKTTISHPFVKCIYDNYFGLGYADGKITLSEAAKTIFIPRTFTNIYNLLPVKAEGKSFKISTVKTGRYMYDYDDETITAVGDVLTVNNNALYYLESFVIGRPFLNHLTYEYLGKQPTNKELLSNSNMRVYVLVDDLNAPNYYSFMIKPIGVDTFVIDYPSNIENLLDIKVGLIKKNKQSGQHIFLIDDLIGEQTQPTRKALFNTSKILSVFSSKLKQNGGKLDNYTFSFFLYSKSTGIIYNINNEFEIQFKVAGTPFKFLPVNKI